MNYTRFIREKIWGRAGRSALPSAFESVTDIRLYSAPCIVTLWYRCSWPSCIDCGSEKRHWMAFSSHCGGFRIVVGAALLTMTGRPIKPIRADQSRLGQMVSAGWSGGGRITGLTVPQREVESWNGGAKVTSSRSPPTSPQRKCLAGDIRPVVDDMGARRLKSIWRLQAITWKQN